MKIWGTAEKLFNRYGKDIWATDVFHGIGFVLLGVGPISLISRVVRR